MAHTVALSMPRRPVARALGLAGFSLLAAALLAASPTPATAWNQSSAEATLWQLLNGARVNNGVRPLQQHSTLVGLARWRSRDMIDRNYFSHTVLGTGYQVYHWYDTNGLRYVLGGENIGWNSGYSDADSPIRVHEGFMASAGHRDNVLRARWTHGGVGAAASDGVNYLGQQRNPRLYTELFMEASASAPPPPSAPRPPSGGSAPRPAAPAGPPPAAPPPPTPAKMSVAAPTRPAPAAALDGPILLVAAPRWSDAAVLRAEALHRATVDLDSPMAEAASVGRRIEAAQPAAVGLLESVLGSLLGFFLG